METLAGKRILILQQRGWGMTIGHMLAKKLHAEGCTLAALTFKKSTHEYVISQTEVPYELVVNNDAAVDDPEGYLNGRTISLETICRDLNIDSVWPLAAALRNHVRSYREKYYYAYRQNVPDETISAYIQATYSYIEHIFATFKPELIISPNFVSLPHIMLNLYANKRGVRMIAVTDTKVRNYYMFSYSYQDTAGPVFDRLTKLNAGDTESDNRAKARDYIASFRDSFIQPTYAATEPKKSLYKRIRHELSPYRQIWMWYTKPQPNELKGIGPTLDYKPPRIILRDFYAAKRYRRAAERFPYTPIENIGKCVYFPLQFQPEASIDVFAPYFNNQIEVARLVAQSLPGDYTLMVKEHPAMVGYRTPSYLEKLARTPNVKLIDYRIPSETALKKADAIISANSTSLVEAAFYYLPAIQLGNLGTTLALPNVRKHTDLTTISHVIRETLAANLHTDDYERRLENYIAAVYDAGFDYQYIKAWEQGTENLETLWQIYRSEIVKSVCGTTSLHSSMPKA